MKSRLWRGTIAAFFAHAIAWAQAPDGASLMRSASKSAADLAKGCIVTGESREGKVTLGLAGSAPAMSDGRPEHVAFEIGSITKVFNGLLLASMVTRGELALDTTVAAVLGAGQTFADVRVGRITLQQLVTHTSGLPRIPDDLWTGSTEGDPYAHYDAKRLTGCLAKVRLEGDPPRDASYSNLGAGLLGHLMAVQAGRPWEELIRERVCAPLGLNQTGVEVKDASLTLAPPFSGDKEELAWNFDALQGAGSLRSTVTDLLRLGAAFIDPGSTPLAREIQLTCTPHAEFPSLGCQIGLGVFIGRSNGQVLFDHGGGTGGYRSLWRVIPSRKLVRVVLVNNSKVEPGPIMAAADPEKKRPKPTATSEITLSEEQLKRFPGVYRLERDTAFTVVLHNAGLRVRLSGQPFLEIFPKAPNRFFYKAVEAELLFEGGGEIPASLTLFQDGRELKAKRTEETLPTIVFRDSLELRCYTGLYTMIGGSVFEVTLRGNCLFAKLDGQPALPVFETGEDEFEYDVVEARLTFTRGDDGEINGLVLHQNGLTLPAPRNAE